jgi:hypothetical protein
MTENPTSGQKEDPGGGGRMFRFLCSCVPGAPFEHLDMPLDSGQQEQLVNVVGRQMNTGEGHQGVRVPTGTGAGAPLSSSLAGSSEQHHLPAPQPKTRPDLHLLASTGLIVGVCRR